jgi:hypothetical protein
MTTSLPSISPDSASSTTAAAFSFLQKTLPGGETVQIIATVATIAIVGGAATYLISKASSKPRIATINATNDSSSFWKKIGKTLLILAAIAGVLAASYFLFGPLALAIVLLSLFVIVGIATQNPFWLLALFFI